MLHNHNCMIMTQAICNNKDPKPLTKEKTYRKLIMLEPQWMIHLPKTWLVLDIASTISSICNVDLVYNETKLPRPVQSNINEGQMDYNLMGQLVLIPMKDYVYTSEITNKLSMGELTKKFGFTWTQVMTKG